MWGVPRVVGEVVMMLRPLRVRFRNFRNFDFWSQIWAGSDLEKLGEHLGNLHHH